MTEQRVVEQATKNLIVAVNRYLAPNTISETGWRVILATAGAMDREPELVAASHSGHPGNHIGYACGFSGPHCWGCNEPWPCRTSRQRQPDAAEGAGHG